MDTINYGVVLNKRLERTVQLTAVRGTIVRHLRNHIKGHIWTNGINYAISIRINVYSTHMLSFINDEPIRAFAHKTSYEGINMIEAWCDKRDRIDISYMRRHTELMPVLYMNTGCEGCGRCANREKEGNCKLWVEWGYCEEFSAYQVFMEEWCKEACGWC